MTESEKRAVPPESSQDVHCEAKGDKTTGEPDGRAGQGVGSRRGQPARSGLLIWLALVIALAAIGLAAYPFWSHWLNLRPIEQAGPSASEFDRLAVRVDEIRQDFRAETEALRNELQQLASDFEREAQGPDEDALAGRIEQLSVRIERLEGERTTDMAGLRKRLEVLESGVGRRLEQFELRLSSVGGNLDQTEDDLATRLLLVEVDSLFAIASNSVTLSGDTGVALQAWERAMARLTTVDGAEFQRLKETARREFRQLREYQPPDVASRVERLFDMADAVAEWPARTIPPAAAPVESGTGEGWRSRLGEVVGSLVRVESADSEFLGPDEVSLAREWMSSALRTAALATARARPDLARRLSAEVVDAAPRVFDTEAAGVSEALTWLEETAASSPRVELPGLGDSRAEISRLLEGMR